MFNINDQLESIVMNREVQHLLRTEPSYSFTNHELHTILSVRDGETFSFGENRFRMTQHLRRKVNLLCFLTNFS